LRYFVKIVQLPALLSGPFFGEAADAKILLSGVLSVPQEKHVFAFLFESEYEFSA